MVKHIVTDDGKAMVMVGTTDDGEVVVSIYYDRRWDGDATNPESYRECEILRFNQQTDERPDGRQ